MLDIAPGKYVQALGQKAVKRTKDRRCRQARTLSFKSVKRRTGAATINQATEARTKRRVCLMQVGRFILPPTLLVGD